MAERGYAPKVILSARLAKWQTYEDYTSWRYARKFNMLPEDALSVASHKADSTFSRTRPANSRKASHNDDEKGC